MSHVTVHLKKIQRCKARMKQREENKEDGDKPRQEKHLPCPWRPLMGIGSYLGMFLVTTMMKDTDEEGKRIFMQSKEPRILRKT